MEKQLSLTIVIVSDHSGAALHSPKCLFIRFQVLLATGAPVLFFGRPAFVGGEIKHSLIKLRLGFVLAPFTKARRLATACFLHFL